jgi:hypothetical protein
MGWYTAAPDGKKLAVSILANLTRLAGTVTAVYPNGFEFVGGGGPGEASGHIRVFVDSHTTYAQGQPADIKVGRELEVTGLDVGQKRVAASALNIWPLR